MLYATKTTIKCMMKIGTYTQSVYIAVEIEEWKKSRYWCCSPFLYCCTVKMDADRAYPFRLNNVESCASAFIGCTNFRLTHVSAKRNGTVFSSEFDYHYWSCCCRYFVPLLEKGRVKSVAKNSPSYSDCVNELREGRSFFLNCLRNGQTFTRSAKHRMSHPELPTLSTNNK